MNRTETPTGSPWLFFLLTFALVLPFYGMGLLTDRGLLAELRVKLPVSALAFVCSIGAALILAVRERRGAVKAFLGRVFSLRGVRSWVWIAAAVLLLPVLYLVSYAIHRGLGIPLPTPQVSPVTIGVFVVLFFVAAIGEEGGWTGYAIGPLQARWGALGGALIVGVVWALIHVIPDIQNHNTLTWIVGQRLFSVALRVLIVWIYNNTGRTMLAAVVVHAMDNVDVFTVFPDNGGGHYVPGVTAALTAIAAVVVTLLWGARTLARFRFGR